MPSTVATVFICQLILITCGSLTAAKQVNSVETTISSQNKIKIINHVNNCINITPAGIRQTDYGILLLTSTGFKKVTAYCGCKSQLLSYSVKEILNIKGGGVKLERVRGLKNSRSAIDKPLEFIISTDKDISYRGNLEIEIGCAPPD